MAIDLAEYMTEKKEFDKSRIDRIDSQLEAMLKNPIAIEEIPRNTLLCEKLSYLYPRINLEFLSMNNKKDGLIYVPKFGVHKENEPSMIMELSYNYGRGIMQNSQVSCEIRSPKELPSLLTHSIVKSVQPVDIQNARVGFRYGCYEVYYDYNILDKLSKEERTKFKGFIKKLNKQRYELKSSVQFIIPDKARENINKARKYFRNDIFFISEIKPEEWNVTRILRDPLVVGTVQDKCFLIDKFETTPLEDYVSKEFTS